MPDVERLNGVLFNVVSGGGENLRTPTVFKTAVIAAASTQVSLWTPASGFRFRLLGIQVIATANLSCATNDLECRLNDTPTGSVTFMDFPFFAPTTAVTTTPGGVTLVGLALPGNGYLSKNINNTLQIVLSTALVTGTVRINAWGTEE